MADKKITALTALGAGDPDPAVDLLHIIDYSASPVNKKITVANLFSRVDTSISSIGATTFEIAPTTAISGFKVNVANATPAGGAETEVVVNDNSNAFVDFRVESDASAQAIYSDASANLVYINGDAADVDFCVKGDTGVTAFTDASYDALGVGTNVLDGSYRTQIAGDGVVLALGTTTSASTVLTMTTADVDRVQELGGTVTVLGPSIAEGTTITVSGSETTTFTLSIAAVAAETDATLTFIKASATGGALQLQGWMAYASCEEHRSSDGAFNFSNQVGVTRLDVDDATAAVAATLTTTGAKDGQMKYIYISGDSSTGTFSIAASNRTAVPASLVMDSAGDSVTLMYDASISKWIVLSANGTA